MSTKQRYDLLFTGMFLKIQLRTTKNLVEREEMVKNHFVAFTFVEMR